MNCVGLEDFYEDLFDYIREKGVMGEVVKVKVRFLNDCKDFNKKFLKGEVAFIDDFRAKRFISMGDAELIEDAED